MTTYDQLLDAGVHFGHLKRKWNPRMAPYIFMEKSGIHIIDLHKTQVKMEEAAHALKQIAKSGKKVLYVSTKKQVKDIVANEAKRVNMPYITERWPGGMLTNFATIRKSVKKMTSLDKMLTDGTAENISKRERLFISRQKAKLEKLLGSITDLGRQPAALLIVDIVKEHIAVKEAQKLNIPTFAIVDTNADPTQIDFPIPGNDDATKSVALIMGVLTNAIEEGLAERRTEKEAEKDTVPAAEREEQEARAAAGIFEPSDEDDAAVVAGVVKTTKASGKALRPRKPGAPKLKKD